MPLSKYFISILLSIFSYNSYANWQIASEDDHYTKYTDAYLSAQISNLSHMTMLIGCKNSIATGSNELRLYFYFDNMSIANQNIEVTIQDQSNNFINKNMVINGNYIMTTNADNFIDIFNFMKNKKIVTVSIKPYVMNIQNTKFSSIFKLDDYNEIITLLENTCTNK